MRVVVTGASGNIGTGVLAALERDPAVDEVVAVARRAPERPLGAPKVRWAAADIARDDLAPVMAGVPLKPPQYCSSAARQMEVAWASQVWRAAT